MKAILTFMALVITTVIHSQTIEKFSIDSGGASTIVGNIEILYTIGEVNVQELSTGNLSVSEGFINAEFEILINPKLFLQGPILNPNIAGLMNDDLRSSSYIPTTSPYSDTANCNATVFTITGNNAIVDWVWVELRNANDNTIIVNAKSALLQRDGDVVGVDGTSNLVMSAAPTNYFVVVKHRNHLGAMSANVIGVNESTATVVDFTNSAFSTYGSNAQVILNSGDTALWAGDVNGDNQINFSGSNNDANAIKDGVLADPANGFNSVTFTSFGYLFFDLDLNDFGKFSGANNDGNIIKDNVLAHPNNGFNSSTFTISTTVP